MVCISQNAKLYYFVLFKLKDTNCNQLSMKWSEKRNNEITEQNSVVEIFTPVSIILWFSSSQRNHGNLEYNDLLAVG